SQEVCSRILALKDDEIASRMGLRLNLVEDVLPRGRSRVPPVAPWIRSGVASLDVVSFFPSLSRSFRRSHFDFIHVTKNHSFALFAWLQGSEHPSRFTRLEDVFAISLFHPEEE